MKLSLAMWLVLGIARMWQPSRGQAEGAEVQPEGDAPGRGDCRANPVLAEAGATELSVTSAHNESGHWSAKVHLQHEAATKQPVHLQLQRSARKRRGGTQVVALEATLSGSSKFRSDDHVHTNESLHTPSAHQCPTCPTPPSPLPLPSAAPSQSVPHPTCPLIQECPSPCASCPSCPKCPDPLPCPSPCQANCPELPKCTTCPTCPSCPVCPQMPRRIPAGYEHHQGLGYYRFHVTPRSWFDAAATCEREGAHLVILNSKAEAAQMARYFHKYNIPDDHYGIRIGINDILEEGKFYTVLGQPLQETGFAEWSTNEPSQTGGNEDCGSIYPTAKMNDVPCDWEGTFICELPQ